MCRYNPPIEIIVSRGQTAFSPSLRLSIRDHKEFRYAKTFIREILFSPRFMTHV